MREFTTPIQDVPHLLDTFVDTKELLLSLPADIQGQVKDALIDALKLGWNLANLDATRAAYSQLTFITSGKSRWDPDSYRNTLLRLKEEYEKMVRSISSSDDSVDE